MHKVAHESSEAFLHHVEKARPRIVFLTGKTSTGKTTLAKKLVDLGYAVVVLDKIVWESVVEHFGISKEEGSKAYHVYNPKYKDIVPAEWRESFIRAAKEKIVQESAQGPVLVDGAIADNDMLREIFSGDLANFSFVFLHPTHHENYAARVAKRLAEGFDEGTNGGLPVSLVKDLTPEDREHYHAAKVLHPATLKKVHDFAQWSAEESQRRLDYFREEFDDIEVVAV
jgi:adenylate kinase family enzyme